MIERGVNPEALAVCHDHVREGLSRADECFAHIASYQGT